MTDEIYIKITNTKTHLVGKYKVHRLQIEKAMDELPSEDPDIASKRHKVIYAIRSDGRLYDAKKVFSKVFGHKNFYSSGAVRWLESLGFEMREDKTEILSRGVDRSKVEKAIDKLDPEKLGISSLRYRGVYVVGPDGNKYGVKKVLREIFGHNHFHSYDAVVLLESLGFETGKDKLVTRQKKT